MHDEEYKNDNNKLIDLESEYSPEFEPNHEQSRADSVIASQSLKRFSNWFCRQYTMRIADLEMEMTFDNPQNWNWYQIKHWLNKRGLDKNDTNISK